ncbi:urease accessory protein UreD [Rhodopseudomonas palustris]|uniref:Urease accessory protein UreD n=1 Tax=Rhodopseudomonas palustris TaxID=1076 RepID=A0A418VJN6_RHOPL|nr:urease accessory protein UreD [Rhodopseudomonas palustris]RJF76328.1 urease accessory protein UreD [Rhodopseudomonas palustris]
MQLVPPSCFAADAGRVSAARLTAEFAGGRTMLRRQQVGYPWHLGRGFYLDADKPDLLTLYLQSASGGMYAADDLSFDIEVGAGAALHLTTQAATLVHACRDAAASLRQRVHVAAGGFAALTNDPYILFPEAELQLATSAVVDPNGVLILADGFGAHRPTRFEGTFTRFASDLRVTRPDGSLLLLDRGALRGADLGNAYDALGGAGAAGSVIVIAPEDRLPAPEAIEAVAERVGCFAGVSTAPNDAGFVVRMTAPDGGGLTRGLTAAFHVIAEVTLGIPLAMRRK